MVFHLPLTYLLASVSLNLAGVLLFLVLIIFGVDPKFAPNFRNLVIALITIVFYLFFGGLIFWKLEGWVYEDSIMFCLVTLTSIGYGNIAPTTLTTRLIVIFYGMSGLGFVAFAIEQFRFFSFFFFLFLFLFSFFFLLDSLESKLKLKLKL